MIRAAILGASGYVGGELLRVLLAHPCTEITAATSVSHAGRRADAVHPNLRGLTDIRFCPAAELGRCDVLFSAVPHGIAMELVPGLAGIARHVIDTSADFRLRDPAVFAEHYGPHRCWELVSEFAPGLPELYRKELVTARHVAVPGCMATAAMLALYPAAARGLIMPDVHVDCRTGSSGGGRHGPLSTHPVRSGALRVFAPLGHRHQAEIEQATGLRMTMTATGVEAVRGVQVLCRAAARSGVTESAVRAAYREHYAGEPFIRLIGQRRGPFRYPEPKILSGTNFCDIGLASDKDARLLLIMAALDNLGKGSAGNAVQCMNVLMGWPERYGLEFPGLYPA